ncbi:polyribonucleotide nucleotidyltransferase [Nostoc sp. FACHB-973]|nr:polyribonucleotide nucleotidyltransferase [Nostoc sp. FACHB-973]
MGIGDLFRNIVGGIQKRRDEEWDNRDRILYSYRPEDDDEHRDYRYRSEDDEDEDYGYRYRRNDDENTDYTYRDEDEEEDRD